MIKFFRDNKTSRISSVGTTVFLWLLTCGRGANGHETDGLVVRGLIETTDAVLEGTVEGLEVTGAGVWHHFRVRTVVHGEARGSTVSFFSHGREFPESVELSVGASAIVGIVWLSEDKGTFHQRLIDDWFASGNQHPAGMVAPDSVLVVDEVRRSGLIEEIKRLTVSPATQDAARAEATTTTHARLFRLLESRHQATRAEALRRLTVSDLDWTVTDSSAIRDAFKVELKKDANRKVIQGFLDLIRTKEIIGCDGTLCQLVLEREETVLVAEGIDTIRRVGGSKTLTTLATRYARSSVRSKARIIRALGATRWAGTSFLARQAIESGDATLVAASVEALGELGTGEAADLLDQNLDSWSGRIREMTIEALARHRTPLSRALLRNALNRSEARERRLIRRVLKPAGRRKDRRAHR